MTRRLRAEREREKVLSAALPPGAIAVVGPVAGAGRSTVAALLALALADRHARRVLAVQAGAGDGLLRRLAGRPGGSTQAVLAALGVREAGAPGRLGAVGQRWLRDRLDLGGGPLLLAADPATAEQPLTAVEYAPVTTALARWFPTLVVDTPPLTTDPVVPTVLTPAERVVIVVPGGPEYAERSARCRSWIAPLLCGPIEQVAVEVLVGRPGGQAGPVASPAGGGALACFPRTRRCAPEVRSAGRHWAAKPAT